MGVWGGGGVWRGIFCLAECGDSSETPPAAEPAAPSPTQHPPISGSGSAELASASSLQSGVGLGPAAHSSQVTVLLAVSSSSIVFAVMYTQHTLFRDSVRDDTYTLFTYVQ
jgi:hypothetical protein